MKIKKEGYVLRNIADQFIVVPVGEQADKIKGVITLNETGAFLWQLLETDQTVSSMTEAMLQEYNVNKETASQDIQSFLRYLEEHCFIEF